MDGDQVRIGVYNLYWHTFGGGEQQAGGIVDALTGEHQVELLGPRPFDLDTARERLGVRFDNVSFRRVPGDEAGDSLVSADYDVFINHTYRSTVASLAQRSIYFVMFPHRLDASRRQRVVERIGVSPERAARVLGGVARRGADIEVDRTMSVQVPLSARHVRMVLRSTSPEVVRVSEVARGAAPAERLIDGTVSIDVGLTDGHHGSVLLSPAVVGDDRGFHQHLYLDSLEVDGRSVPHDPTSLARRLVPVRHRAFLDSYDRVVALSEYTRRWSLEWWGRGDDVISPPVRLRAAVALGAKAPVIVSIGRFFDPASGHSKRQLELVAAFRQLVEQGLEGWRLVLIGGARPEDRDYAMAVRRAAAGLPVEVRFSAPGDVVDSTLASASIYWHGAGYGSDLDAAPDRAEHFGIAPIEAMSTGAVPVVFAAAGPAEVVEHDVSGLQWRTIDELVAHTRRLIDDVALRERLATGAVQRAAGYDEAHFRARVQALLADVVSDGPASIGKLTT